MLNITILILTLLILISQNILLLNEESLILLCFVMFTWLIYNKLKSSIQHDLESKALSIYNSIESSFNSILLLLKLELDTQQGAKSLISDFFSLKQHFIKLTTFVTLNLKKFTLNNLQKSYKKKLIFTQRLEKQTSKLLALLIIKKLNKIVNLHQYYLKDFPLITWNCIYKISLREYFEII
uniref:ATP synthase B chain n=1 Tax=Gelidium sclerophyllum TaxID=317102 RepID=A0A1D8X7I1_9FLOR|nr:ATP synthase B chain precursor [Gelidium sclerophyllum]AOX48989.1 ATP synthase B chain precursor [Gelidium sclerophyllum]